MAVHKHTHQNNCHCCRFIDVIRTFSISSSKTHPTNLYPQHRQCRVALSHMKPTFASNLVSGFLYSYTTVFLVSLEVQTSSV